MPQDNKNKDDKKVLPHVAGTHKATAPAEPGTLEKPFGGTRSDAATNTPAKPAPHGVERTFVPEDKKNPAP